MTDQQLRDLERRLELLLCAITARLNPNREHPLSAHQQAVHDDDLDRRISTGLADLREHLP